MADYIDEDLADDLADAGQTYGIFMIEDRKGDLKSIKADAEFREFIEGMEKLFGDVHIIRADNRDVDSEVLLLGPPARNEELIPVRFAVDYAGAWHRISRLSPVTVS